MTDRSNRREVRNPVLALPGTKAVLALPPYIRAALCALLTSIRDDARAKAQQSWVKNKGPMAAYWKAVGAYVEHIRRVIKPSKGEIMVEPFTPAEMEYLVHLTGGKAEGAARPGGYFTANDKIALRGKLEAMRA